MNKRVLMITITLVALVAIGVIVRERWPSQQGLEDNKEIAENTNGFHIETLSDKEIYSPSNYASVCYDVPQIKIELVSITNSYAILNDIAYFLQAVFLATEKFWNIVDTNNGVVINKQSCLSQFLLTIFFWSIMSPIQQFNSCNSGNATILILLNTFLAYNLITPQ